MAGIQLYKYQKDAVEKMHNGCILCGGVGSGKSRTALAYYYIQNGGEINSDSYISMDDPPQDLYIITTARKRDTYEWDDELIPFLLSTKKECTIYSNKVVIDSWNNIVKYTNVRNAFFIFDEQRLVGNGVWVKSFLEIAKSNKWILLSATPGDTWMDYVPVFLANGFYKNRTEFINHHVIYNPYTKFRKVDRYISTGRLIYYRNQLLVDMDFDRKTVAHHEDIYTDYNIILYKDIGKNRWNPYTNKPVKNINELCGLWRMVVNTDESKQEELLYLFSKHRKIIVFYNFDYELEILKNLYYGEDVTVAEWNGHKHEPVPDTKKWVYLVQYNAGAEGWNCIKTDTIVFFSENYSYKIMAQACGRIDRLNTPYKDLYYYHLKSHAPIDRAISLAIKKKKTFSERKFVKQ